MGKAAAVRWAAWFAASTQRDLRLAHAWQHGRRLEGGFTTSEATDAPALERAVEARLAELARAALVDAQVSTVCRALAR
jgi:hypothetical protein